MNRNLLILFGIVVLVGLLFWFWPQSSSVPQGDSDSQATTTQTPSKSSAGATTKPSSSGSGGTAATLPGDQQSVSYTARGFTPTNLVIGIGQAVTFLNDNSAGAMRIVTTQVPSLPNQKNPGFDQGRSASKGETFIYVFTIPGEWHYKNLNNSAHTGIITVVGG